MCTTKDDYDDITPIELSPEERSHAENRLIVLNTFERRFTVEEDGERVQRTTMGVILSSKTLLERVRLLTDAGQPIAIQVRSLVALPVVIFCLLAYAELFANLLASHFAFCCVAQADGTYKLHRGGWTLCDLGSHICRWDASTRKNVHTFYPLLYMFCRTECLDAYMALFETLRCIPTLFGVEQPLSVDAGGLDRSAFIAEAYLRVWPEITLLLCWPHLARKFASNEFWVKLKVKENKQPFEKHIRALHACRSANQFRLLSTFVLRVWTSLDERLFAKYFEEYYVCGHWGNWFVTAAPFAGVLPNAQGIENGHKIQKLVIGRYAPVRCALCRCGCALLH